MVRPRVLVSRHVYPSAITELQKVADVTYHDAHDAVPGGLCAAIVGHDALVCQLTDTVDAAVLGAEPRLRIVANIAVGHDNIDVEAATRSGVFVTNTPGVLTESTADLTMALVLATARRLPEAERFLRAGRWRRWEIDLLCGGDVHARQLGIVGMGRIGQAVARRARGFDMDIVYHGRSALAAARERELGVRRVGFEELLSTSDFVSLHVPLGEDTQHLIGARELGRMRGSGILINTARGPIVDEAALIDALRRGTIAGAGLDVFADEPEVPEALLAMQNVVLLPHIGSATIGTRTRMCELAAENVVAALRGAMPPHLVNGDLRA